MSSEQYKIQSSVFAPDTYENISREEAIRELYQIGVVNLDGSFTDEYKFLERKGHEHSL